MLHVLDLFSGIGGFSLGLERTGGFRTVQFCEIDPFCRAVLRKHWPDVPVHDDIRTLARDAADSERAERRPLDGARDGLAQRPDSLPQRQEGTGRLGECGQVDVICGGFPCQPFSVAGKRRGAADDRHLWPEMLRVIQTIRPRWVIGENVAGIIKLALDGVLSDLEGIGYTCQAFTIPACAVDAPHRRERVWIVAHAAWNEPGRQEQWTERKRTGLCSQSGDAADAASARLQGLWSEHQLRSAENGEQADGSCRWQPEPSVGRVAHGISRRVDRLKSLGNAVVPQVVEEIGRSILKAERMT